MTTRRLVFHIGSLKTGTTAIQAALSGDRERLAAHGIHYPTTTPEFPPARSAHHRIAHAVHDLGLRNRIGLFLYFRRLRRQAAQYRTTLLSAEPVYRRVAVHPVPDDSDAWFEGRRIYLERLAGWLDGFETEIVLYLRPPHDYALSLYKEAAAKARRARLPAFDDMARTYTPQFEYPRHVALLRNIFGRVEVRSYDAEARRGLVAGFYERLGLDPPPETEGARVRTSVSNRGVMWLRAQGTERSHREQRRRILYAVRDPDGIFREGVKSTLWPSRDAYERFVDRFAASYGMDVIGPAPAFSGVPCLWTDEMQAEADNRYRVWRDANLAMLNEREAKGLRHFHP